MDVNLIWKTICIPLLFLQTAYLNYVTRSKTNWTESFKECSHLQNRLEINEGYTAWVGALHVTTPWMVHLGCFKNPKSRGWIEKTFNDNSPDRCSVHCKKYIYFSLKNESCYCSKTKPKGARKMMSKCDKACIGSGNDLCGSINRKYFNLYKHVTGKNAPEDNQNQYYKCSIIQVFNGSSTIRAEDCFRQHKTICESMQEFDNQSRTFDKAKNVCLPITNITKYLNSTKPINHGQYWTGVHRRKLKLHLNKMTDDEICNELTKPEEMRCIMLNKTTQRTSTVPTSCSDSHHARCSDSQRLPLYSKKLPRCVKGSHITTNEAQNSNTVKLVTTTLDKDFNRKTDTISKWTTPSSYDRTTIESFSNPVSLYDFDQTTIDSSFVSDTIMQNKEDKSTTEKTTSTVEYPTYGQTINLFIKQSTIIRKRTDNTISANALIVSTTSVVQSNDELSTAKSVMNESKVINSDNDEHLWMIIVALTPPALTKIKLEGYKEVTLTMSQFASVAVSSVFVIFVTILTIMVVEKGKKNKPLPKRRSVTEGERISTEKIQLADVYQDPKSLHVGIYADPMPLAAAGNGKEVYAVNGVHTGSQKCHHEDQYDHLTFKNNVCASNTFIGGPDYDTFP